MIYWKDDDGVYKIDDYIEKHKHDVPISYLYYLKNQERVYDGTPHVTDLLKGTREYYLEIINDYSVDPLEYYSLVTIGSGLHKLLEVTDIELKPQSGLDAMHKFNLVAPRAIMAMPEREKTVKAWNIQGKIDLVDDGTIWDYKVIGGFRVARILKGDFGDYGMQANIYKLLYEKQEEKQIDHLKLSVWVRDSGTMVSRNFGIEKSFYPSLDVPFQDKPGVFQFMTHKRDAILEALKNKTLPARCTQEECWGGKKCISQWCPVSEICAPKGQHGIASKEVKHALPSSE